VNRIDLNFFQAVPQLKKKDWLSIKAVKPIPPPIPTPDEEI
jgi:hypothetical protein